MNDPTSTRPVLILGAGVNGCAVARELVLNNVPVVLVDKADVATGATAKSSRLIHGGVRYLEYADFHLVAESLHERERLLHLAPQFVHPLRLHIPVRRRLGGLVQSGSRFLGLTRFSLGRTLSERLSPWTERGLYTVQFGLWMYDLIARSSLLPEHSTHRLGTAGTPKLDEDKYAWVCSYSDAQMPLPERFVVALLHDAELHAREHSTAFHVLPYHEVELKGRVAAVHQVAPDGAKSANPMMELEPSVIINATGAWGDLTLAELGIASDRLFGGTKGSHIITRHAGLRAAIGGDGIYAESGDGRLVFVLPFGESTLIGTTDLRFEGSPGDAVATPEEIRYLLEMTNSVFAGLNLSEADVHAHYCGVRPLPFVPGGKTGAIPRGHSIHTSDYHGIPLHTLIGGKLTTWRAFGEEVTDRVLAELQQERTAETQDRLIPGAADYPSDPDRWIEQTAAETGHPAEAVRFLFRLSGTSARELLKLSQPQPPVSPELPISTTIVKELIRREWVTTLCDLVERRLALLFGPPLTLATLETLTDCLVSAGKLEDAKRSDEIERCKASLSRRYGILI